MPRDDVVVLFATEEGRTLVRRVCRDKGVPMADLKALVDLEVDQVGRDKKKGLWPQFDDVLDAMDEAGAAQG